MRGVLYSPEAALDLREIWQFIARDSLVAADRVTDEIREHVALLATMPGIGHERADVPKAYRVSSVYSYLIIYRYDDSSLTVIRIVHGARRLRPLFRRS
jgi:toxin ParE1/3/4